MTTIERISIVENAKAHGLYEQAPLLVNDKNPDIIITHADQTMRFKMQNRNASKWLRKHYHSSAGEIKGDTEFYVHPTRCKRVVEELKAAGFIIQTP